MSKPLQPFPEKEYISTQRACGILGVTPSEVYLLARQGKLEMVDYRRYAPKRIRYKSVVDFCDAVRRRHAIPDRRPALSHPMFRHRDEDLLPFRLVDTITVKETMMVLGFNSKTTVTRMLEEGRIEAYQLEPGGYWRVSCLSLASFLRRVMPSKLQGKTQTGTGQEQMKGKV